MYECFHCCTKSVIWDSDFSFEDYGEEGEGIIHECHCSNCGAMITYRIPLGDIDDLDMMPTDSSDDKAESSEEGKQED